VGSVLVMAITATCLSNVLVGSRGSDYGGIDGMGGGSLANNSVMMNSSGPALDEG